MLCTTHPAGSTTGTRHGNAGRQQSSKHPPERNHIPLSRKHHPEPGTFINAAFKEAVVRASGWNENYVNSVGHGQGNIGLTGSEHTDTGLLITLPSCPPVLAECTPNFQIDDPETRLMETLTAGVFLLSSGQRIQKAVTVVYPERNTTRQNPTDAGCFLNGAPLRWKFFDVTGNRQATVWPFSGYLKGTIFDFVESVENLPAEVSTINATSREVSKLVGSAAEAAVEALAPYPEETERISSLMGCSGNPDAGLRAAAVVWFNGLLTLNALTSNTRKGRCDVIQEGDYLNGPQVLAAWQKTINENKVTVLDAAVGVYPQVRTPDNYSKVFFYLIQAAQKAEGSTLGETVNIGGEVFARVMDIGERKNSAAFYTRSLYAEFLTRVVLPSRGNLPERWQCWRIGDFACGTGALLRAGYRRLRRLVMSEEHPPDGFYFHKVMTEEGLYGLDINPVAVHLTASGIAAFQPGAVYNRTNFRLMKLGAVKPYPRKPEDVLTGSIELLNRSRSQGQLIDVGIRGQTETNRPISAAAGLCVEDETFDAVLMNPPYSRSRNGQSAYDLPGINRQERLLLQKREQSLIQGTCGNRKAGMSTTFAAIADRKLKNLGRVGLVLPLTAAASGSYREMRSMFETGYRDVTAVTFGGGESISEDTGMGEMMLFARKGSVGREGVGYAHLDGPLVSVNDGVVLAQAVTEALDTAEPGESGQLTAGDVRAGSWYAAYPTTGVGRPWGGAGVYDLTGFYPDADRLTAGVIDKEPVHVEFPMTTVGDLFTVGPTHHLIGHLQGRQDIGAFVFHTRASGLSGQEETPHLSMWSSNSGQQVSVLTEPTHYGVEHRAERASVQIDCKSDMFYQRGMRWTSQKILVAVTDELTLGGAAWAALRGGNETVRLAFAVWANSVFGFVNHWTVAQRQQTGRSQLHIGDIRRAPCPDFRCESLLARAERYLRYRRELFRLVMEPAAYAVADRNRRRLDVAAADILGVPEQFRAVISEWFAERWCHEPKVSGGKVPSVR